MELKQLFGDQRAVSPVIGVILMVAITVILAAVIGTFVLGLGDQLQTTTPQASFGFEASDDNTEVSITHESGDSIQASNVIVSATADIVDDDTAGDGTKSEPWGNLDDASADDTVSAGDSVTITRDGGNWGGQTIRVIYDNPDSDSSSTLAKFEVPE